MKRPWIVERVVTFVEAIYAPETALARRLEGPSYLVPLCILGLLSVVLAHTQAPLNLQWTQYQLEAAGAPPEQVAASISLIQKSNRLAFIFVPFTLFLRWSLFALLLWLTCQIFFDLLDFQRTLSIVAYSYFPILLRDAMICLVLLLRSEDLLRSADGMNVSVGLNLLFPSMQLPWSSLAGNINIFEGWFVLMLVLGVAKAMGSSWRRALAVVLPNWLFVVLVQFGMVTLGVSLKSSLRP